MRTGGLAVFFLEAGLEVSFDQVCRNMDSNRFEHREYKVMLNTPELPNTHPGNRLINVYREKMQREGLSPEHYGHMVHCINEYNIRMTSIPEGDRSVPYPIPDPSCIKTTELPPKPAVDDSQGESTVTEQSTPENVESGYPAFWMVVFIFILAFYLD